MSSEAEIHDGVIRAHVTAIISVFLDQTIWIVLLAGLAAAGASVVVPGRIGGAICLLVLVLGMFRCSTMRVRVKGRQMVVFNSWRTYRFKLDAIVGCDVVAPRRVPPRIRISVDTGGGRASFNLDATARLSRRARRRIADQLLLWGVVSRRCARNYAELKY